MRKYLFLIATCLLITSSFSLNSCQEAGTNGEGTSASKNGEPAKGEEGEEKSGEHPQTTIQYIEDNVNLGTVKEGDPVEHKFKVVNTGKNPLYIESAKPSCGCTTPSYSDEPIAPGDTGFVQVKFDSKGKEGKNEKKVDLKTNTNPPFHPLKFQVEVIKK